MAVGVRSRAPRIERVGSTRVRILSMVLVALCLAGMVWSRLAYWQVARHGQLAMQAQAQYREVVELPAIRGAIFDRNLTQLVVNTTVYSAFVSPAKFAYISPRRFAKDKADKLTALKLPGVGLELETQRSYLPGISSGTTLASNLLGFVNYNGDGQYGLEAYYQKLLAGTPGYISSYRDL